MVYWDRVRGIPCDVNATDFGLQSSYYIHIRANTFEKGMYTRAFARVFARKRK